MTIDNITEFERSISWERFARYVVWAKGNRRLAMELYLLNCRLIEALYTPLHIVEVTLRNRIHDFATRKVSEIGATLWFDSPEFQLGYRQKEKVAKARQDLSRDKKQHLPQNIVASLNFGYWTSFFGPEYENLWQQGLNTIARAPNGKGITRKAFSSPLLQIRFLRNRIAHHEPVIHWDLKKHHDEILLLTRYLSPAAANWATRHSRFNTVYPTERITLYEE